MTEIDVSVDTRQAGEAVDDWAKSLPMGRERALDRLQVLAENSMKDEAPRGAGTPDVHMANTIETDKEQGRRVTMPRKRTAEGWLLHRAVVGNPSTPTYTDTAPPVWVGAGGEAQGALAEWTRAKLGSRQAAFAVAQNIKERGTQKSFPNPFIERSVDAWISDVEKVATDKVAEALRR
jgi:hypothetical protein